MLLSDYQWSRNPRGMHNQGRPSLDMIIGQRHGIMKLVSLGAEYNDLCRQLLERNITPICRIYRPEHSGVPIDAQMMSEFRTYVQAGVKWFEIYNEPNLAIEWPPGANFDPMNIDGVIRPICDNWLVWAEQIADMGAYAGFIPLSEAGGGWENTTTWINQLLLYMFDNHYNRFMQILANGFWLPTHPYVLNHFYQEMPGGGALSARPPELQNHAEGGWHFEYPYDPISQANDPGRTVWGGTPLSVLGDVHGLIASGQAWLERLQEMFGVGAVPVVGTEGGLWPLPAPGQLRQPDVRYPGFTWESHAHATVAMFRWISEQAPPWMFGVALWKWDNYYDASGGGPMPAAFLMGETTTPFKEVPPIESVGDYVVSAEVEDPVIAEEIASKPLPPVRIVIDPVGPGPIHGEATYHFIMLAPGIDEERFFQVGQHYWERFRPVLMTIPDFINFLPGDSSLAVTVITSPDLVDFMNERIVRRWPNVWMDNIVANSPREIEEILNSRVAVGRRFG